VSSRPSNERDAARVRAFEQRSERRARGFRRLQAEVEGCSKCTGPNDRCEHHERTAEVIVDDGNPWADQDRDWNHCHCSIEGCDNTGRHEFVAVSGEPSEARSVCDEPVYATPENGWSEHIEFVDEGVTDENERRSQRVRDDC
jgi:hypothetical protein